ncbi:MAG: 3-hydroxyacyl-CoA dehydrogenase NAD-binding domain-containing protein [Deinococcales bacterium]
MQTDVMSPYFKQELQDDISIIYLDKADDKINTITAGMMKDFEALLNDSEQNSKVKAVIFISAKQDSYIVGADIKDFLHYQNPEEVRLQIRQGHEIFNRLEKFPKPGIAAIHGAWMGGGLEFALACHYRLATNHPKTVFALPEVKLGLLPGLGGTQRLPRKVGLQTALDMILTGKNVYAKQTKKMNLVEATTHVYGLLEAAKAAAKGLISGAIKAAKRKIALKDRLLEQSPASKLVYDQAEKMVMQQSGGHYPAPLKIIDCIRTGLNEGMPSGLATEAKHFSELVFSPESKALIHLFFAQNAAKKNPARDKIKAVQHVGVLGAGLMGSGIAQVSAQAGYHVMLKDQNLEYALKGKGAIYKDVSKRIGKGLSSFERDEMMERVVAGSSYSPFKAVDLTVEAVLEVLDLKQKVLQEVEAEAPQGHIFASNTSSIPIKHIAEASQQLESVLGMHYFSPVPKMPLLEIITTEKTADWALATAFDVGSKQGKTVIVVGDRPGFYVNRILAPYMDEALVLLNEGGQD